MSLLITLPNIIWEIDKFSTVLSLSSPNFTFLGMKWKLTVVRYPDIQSSDGDKVILMLHRLNPVSDFPHVGDLKFNVISSVVDESNNLPQWVQTAYTKPIYESWLLWTQSMGDIKTLIPTGARLLFSILVSIHGVVSQVPKLTGYVDDENEVDLSHFYLGKDIGKFFNNELYSDFELKCGTCSFRVHKIILSARSEYFAAMFRSDMKEVTQGFAVIDCVEPAILELVLQYTYSGEIPHMSKDAIQKVYSVADRFGFRSLQTKCYYVFIKNYTSDFEEETDENEEVDVESRSEDTNEEKEKLLKALFEGVEWRRIHETFPDLAADMCSAIILKHS